MGPNPTNADDADLLDARQEPKSEEHISDSVFVPVVCDFGSGRFQRPSCPPEATVDRSNTDELRNSTSLPCLWSWWRNRLEPYKKYQDLLLDLEDRDHDSVILPTPMAKINHNSQQRTVTDNCKGSETMDRGDGDYPSRPHSAHPTRRPYERRIDTNSESLQVVNILGKDGKVASFTALICPNQEPSFVNERLLQQFSLVKPVADQERSCKLADFEGEIWEGQRKKETWETLQDFASTCLGGLSHAPLAIASGGAYYMGKWRLDPGRDDFGHQHIAEGGGLGDHTLDTFRAISPPVLFAAIATTSFSLTAYHYILVQQGRDRDLLLLVFIGAGALAGSLVGLDGVEIVMRVVPWCAIAAFLLCAFVIPPRAQESMILEAGGTEELEKETLDTMIGEKEAMMDSRSAGDSELAVGLET